MNLVLTIVLIIGLVLVYSAVKGEDPRELVKRALGQNNE